MIMDVVLSCVIMIMVGIVMFDNDNGWIMDGIVMCDNDHGWYCHV